MKQIAKKLKSKGKSSVKKAAPKKGKTVKKTGRAVSPLRLLTDKKMEQLKKDHASGKLTGKQLAHKYDVSISTLYNYLNR